MIAPGMIVMSYTDHVSLQLYSGINYSSSVCGNFDSYETAIVIARCDHDYHTGQTSIKACSCYLLTSSGQLGWCTLDFLREIDHPRPER